MKMHDLLIGRLKEYHAMRIAECNNDNRNEPDERASMTVWELGELLEEIAELKADKASLSVKLRKQLTSAINWSHCWKELSRVLWAEKREHGHQLAEAFRLTLYERRRADSALAVLRKIECVDGSCPFCGGEKTQSVVQHLPNCELAACLASKHTLEET